MNGIERLLFMSKKIKEIATFLLGQGVGITREVLEEKLQEAYEQGRMENFHKQIDDTLDDIHYNTMMEIKRRKQVLYESNFYNKPGEDAVVEMKALEYLEKHIPEIITKYKES